MKPYQSSFEKLPSAQFFHSVVVSVANYETRQTKKEIDREKPMRYGAIGIIRVNDFHKMKYHHHNGGYTS